MGSSGTAGTLFTLHAEARRPQAFVYFGSNVTAYVRWLEVSIIRN